MQLANRIIFLQYLVWHYFDMPKLILVGWKNYLYFIFNYFSVFTLLKTLFSHWHKYRLFYAKSFEPWKYFETAVFNLFSRIIGFLLRIIFIICGILGEIFVFLSGLVLLLLWLALPFILILGFFYGFKLLF